MVVGGDSTPRREVSSNPGERFMKTKNLRSRLLLSSPEVYCYHVSYCLCPERYLRLPSHRQRAQFKTEARRYLGSGLDSLVAPIAPIRPVAGPTLAAPHISSRTHPVATVAREKQKLKDQALADAVAKQPWSKHPGHGPSFRCSKAGSLTNTVGPPIWATRSWRSKAM